MNFGWTLNYSLEIGWTSEQDFLKVTPLVQTIFSNGHVTLFRISRSVFRDFAVLTLSLRRSAYVSDSQLA